MSKGAIRMLPSLNALSCVGNRDVTRHFFLDSGGIEVAVLEERGDCKMALTGIRTDTALQLAAPTVGTKGRSHIAYGGRHGTCFTEAGANATRTFIVSAYNRGLCTVIRSMSYIVARFDITS